jgi:hypothetical protein
MLPTDTPTVTPTVSLTPASSSLEFTFLEGDRDQENLARFAPTEGVPNFEIVVWGPVLVSPVSLSCDWAIRRAEGS